MRTITLPNGSLGADTVTPITAAAALALKQEGFSFIGRYVTSLSQAELHIILQAGLAVTLFSYANSFDPSDEIRALKNLGIPPEVCVWLDVEGVTDDAITLQARINTWARAIKQASYTAGMYAGAQELLTSQELWNLAVTRYMKSCSRIVDRNGAIADVELHSGWSCNQVACQQQRGGVTVDVDVTYADYLGRKVTMVAA
jgi:hypothetical protein